jgi:hypothetical protein
MTRLFVAAALCAAIGFGAVSADAASVRSCRPVVNPYPDTRYEGVDLTRIRATGVSCRVARRVARRAHRKALRIAPSPDGVRRFRWRAWRVRGDVRGPNDRYLARRGGDRVRWIF